MTGAGWLLAACLVMVFCSPAGVLLAGASAGEQDLLFFWNEEKATLDQWKGSMPDVLTPVAEGGREFWEMDGERVLLTEGVLRVYRDERLIWETPDHWRVTGFDLGEALRDGRTVLTLSVWRKGSFGSGRPFWIEENDTQVRNHFFVHHWDQDRFHPIWQSSALDVPNCEYCLADITGDGCLELVTIEGFYLLEGCGWGRYVSVWFWNGWSYRLLGRSPAGLYRELRVGESNGNRFILVKSELQDHR